MLLTVLSAVAGGLLLTKLKLPGGMLVGAIIAVAALNFFTGEATIFIQTRVLAQAMTGAYIGCMITREELKRMPGIIKPYLVVMVSLLVLCLGMAAFFYWVTDFDLLTCLFCATPGGMTDTPLIAMDMGAEASVVVVMQFIRMMFGLGCLPTIILVSDRIIEPEKAKEMEARAEQLHRGPGKKNKPTLRAFLPVFGVALCAGILGKLSGVPAGTLSAALIVSAGMKIYGKGSAMPMWLRRVAQVISGCCIGCSVEKDQLLQMRQLIIPAVVLCLGYAVFCVGVGLLLSKLFHMNLREAMLCMSPAGATEMALVAADLGVESPNLVVHQICRLMGVLIFFPHIFRFILFLFGA